MNRSIVLTLIGFLTIAPVMTAATTIDVQAVETRKLIYNIGEATFRHHEYRSSRVHAV